MKLLFVVQGEGRGHLTQALTLEQMLRQSGHEVTAILVGRSEGRKVPDFFMRRAQAPVHTFSSPQFRPASANRRAGITRSLAYHLSHLGSVEASVRFVYRMIQESDADAVINFYEVVTGLTYLLLRPKIPMICIAHQYYFLHPQAPLPPRASRMQLAALKFFTRLTSAGATKRLALSLRPLEPCPERRLTVVPPLLRPEVRQLRPTPGQYIHGYMVNAGFAADVRRWHARRPQIPLRFFWDGACGLRQEDPTLSFHGLDDRAFLRQLAGCQAYATTAGFESVAEAMYLGKPVLMVPAHIEQECNAFDAVCCGAGLQAESFDLDRLLAFIPGYRPTPSFRQWTDSASYAIVWQIESALEQQAAWIPQING